MDWDLAWGLWIIAIIHLLSIFFSKMKGLICMSFMSIQKRLASLSSWRIHVLIIDIDEQSQLAFLLLCHIESLFLLALHSLIYPWLYPLLYSEYCQFHYYYLLADCYGQCYILGWVYICIIVSVSCGLLSLMSIGCDRLTWAWVVVLYMYECVYRYGWWVLNGRLALLPGISWQGGEDGHWLARVRSSDVILIPSTARS